LDELCPPHTILASNTSRLGLSDIRAEVNRQDRLVITHYFAPPHIVPGVEVVRGPGTSVETFDLTYGLITQVRKIPLRVLKEVPG
jgi:3-hydroxybutyryl-CoA dehydrogenase